MGGSESRPGYRIMEILNNSPGDKESFQIFLDFIVSLNGTNLIESQLPFQELIKANENCPITLGVLNLLTSEIREVIITPSKWEGEGLLGINLRYEDSIEASQSIMHITSIRPNSPASNVGLVVGDYILGSKEAKIKSANDIQTIIYKNGEITLVIFNKESNKVFPVLLESVDGYIGIEVATGVFHRLSS
ncbi:hypothetical protein SteCoe_8881 [Stentor coeruleus]|uniref:PDZ GRASP-type domain-containing protein n=1 Tax=Stentor coeruleus TaxID=5963 RepID=A0A1R2CJC5_9CILI|nr:hypothetical protein SteCoe_8881 [Stentor coeruleus]